MLRFSHFGIFFVLAHMLKLWNMLCFCEEVSRFYTAAVLEMARTEYHGIYSSEEILRKNLEVYGQAIAKSAENNVDIIVFPEYGLFPGLKLHDRKSPVVENIPDPKITVFNPCNERERFKNHTILTTLSCFAQNNNMYIVANMQDVKSCGNTEDNFNFTESSSSKICRSDGLKIFNTNVVFNRNGTLISRYYKQHLFFEQDIDLPDDPENAYFETDFGSFTTFICFDIMFKDAVNAVKEKHVKNVAFSAYWYDHLPLFNAIQFHQAWAITNKINLLSSNIHQPGTGSMGSAIYSGLQGALIYTFNPDNKTKLLISKVPVNPENLEFLSNSSKFFYLNDGEFVQKDSEISSDVPEQCSRKLLGWPQNLRTEYRCHDVNITGEVTTKLEMSSDQLEVCSNGLCCTLDYEAESIDDEYYLSVQSSIQKVPGMYSVCMENCFLTRCDNFKNESCSIYPLDTNTVFKWIDLKGNFTTEYIYPSVISSGMRLTPTNTWHFNNTQIIYGNKSTKGEKILSIGLHGRCYDRDPHDLHFQ